MKNSETFRADDSQHAVVNALEDIKALLVLLLLKSGATQTEIAKALNITQATVSRQFRFGSMKPFEAAVVNMGKGAED
jgi:DNA-directed RNA polymerase specialized sigma subunit